MNKSDKFPEPKPLNDVAEFHRTFRLPIETSPVIPTPERCALRLNLLQEELEELKEAVEKKDIIEVADALCDLQYVLSGAILEFGLGSRFKELFEEVQRSNLSKACQTEQEAEDTLNYYRDQRATKGIVEVSDDKYLIFRDYDKKVLKSVNYSPADLSTVLEGEHDPGRG